MDLTPHTHIDIHGRTIKPALYNGIFSTIAFLVGAISSVASGFIGMKIATYANARTALEAHERELPQPLLSVSALIIMLVNKPVRFAQSVSHAQPQSDLEQVSVGS